MDEPRGAWFWSGRVPAGPAHGTGYQRRLGVGHQPRHDGRPARGSALGIYYYVSHLGNVVVHVQWAVRHRRYDPGLLTALVALLPAAGAGLRALQADPAISRVAVAAGAAAGAASSIALPTLLKRRSRQTRSPP